MSTGLPDAEFVPVSPEHQRRGWTIEQSVTHNPDGTRTEIVRARRAGLSPEKIAQFVEAGQTAHRAWCEAAGRDNAEGAWGRLVPWGADGVEWSMSAKPPFEGFDPSRTLLDVGGGVGGLDAIVYAVHTGRTAVYFCRTDEDLADDERRRQAGMTDEDILGY